MSYAALVLVSAAVIGTLVLGNLRRNALRDAEANLYSTARLLASMEATNPAHLWSEPLPAQIAEVARETGLHITLLFANGTPAAESVTSLPGTKVGMALAMAEFGGARRAHFGVARRALVPGGAEHLLVAVPILLDYEMIGYARVGMPMAKLAARELELRDGVVTGATVNALIALGLGFFFARHVTRPLAQIGESCRRLAAGNFAERIRLRREDEIGVVADTINQMADEVQQRIHTETRERQRLAALLAVMADGVVAISARQTIAYANEVAARLLALDPAASGQKFHDQVRLAAVREIYEEALAADRRVVREVRVTNHVHDVVLGMDATPLRDTEGGRFGVLLVLHDLTTLRRLEDMRRTFTANVSHELKTPLTAIGALVDTLINDDAMRSEVRIRFLAKIRDQNERLHRLVQELLIIARLEAEKDVLETHAVELGPLLAECVHTFAEVAEKNGVVLAWSPPTEPVVVRGTDEALRLITNNLLHNALTYTPVDGTVAVTLAATRGRATITVHDTGVGIPPEHLERIFERFYRVDRARVRNGSGSGLGLSIVKHLTLALGGQVLVESTPGKGSVFEVQLPLITIG